MATAFIKKLAVEMKSAMATGFTLDDIGIVLDCEAGSACGVGRGSAWGEGLCEESLVALCDLVEAELPFVKADRHIVELHRRAARDCRAEAAYERQQLGIGA